MTIKANMADGTVLSFPDGTDPAVIQRVAKERVTMQPLRDHAQSNIDNNATVKNDDGSTSTVRSGSVDHPNLNGGRPTLIPFVWDGKIVDQEEAERRAIESGIQWPSFDDHDQATKASQSLSGQIQPSAPTPSARDLPEIGESKSLNSMNSDAALASLGLLSAQGTDEAAQILKARFPGTEILEDEEQNLIARMEDGDFALNRPGLSGRDVGQALARFAAFIPSGKVGGQILRRTGEAAAKSGATEATLQGAEAMAGGTFDLSEVGKEAMIGGGFQLGSDILLGGLKSAQNARRLSKELGDAPSSSADTAADALGDLEGFQGETQLTRAQQLNDPFLLEEQAFVSQLPEGSRSAIQFLSKQNADMGSDVRAFVETFGKDESVVVGSRVVRDAAQKAIELKKLARSEKASPLYRKAFSEFEGTVDIKPVQEFIESEFMKYPADHPVSEVLREFNGQVATHADSLEKLQGVKEIADIKLAGMSPLKATGQSASAIKKAQRALGTAESLLLREMDAASPAYREARETFAKESGPVDSLRNSLVGAVADVDDPQLRLVAKKLFNPQETNPELVKHAKKAILSTDNGAEAWDGVLRTELERRLGSVRIAGGSSGDIAAQNIENIPAQLRQALFPNEKSRAVLFSAMDPEQVANAKVLETALKRASSGRPGGSQTGVRREISARFDRGLWPALANFIGRPVETSTRIGLDEARSQRISDAVKVIFSPDWSAELARIRRLAGADQSSKYLEVFRRASSAILPEVSSGLKVASRGEGDQEDEAASQPR